MIFPVKSRPHLAAEFHRLSVEFPDVHSVLLFHQNHRLAGGPDTRSRDQTPQTSSVELIPLALPPMQADQALPAHLPSGMRGCGKFCDEVRSERRSFTASKRAIKKWSTIFMVFFHGGG